MTFGALTFLSPMLLAGLLALPVIYWLLRTVPPRPRQIRFPATRILAELENKEQTPDKTPWWLMLLRLLAAACVIFALAQPVLNPDRALTFSGGGPLALVIDNGWGAAPHWQDRLDMAARVIDEAEREQRGVVVLATAADDTGAAPEIQAPNDARRTVAAMLPQPVAPTRSRAIERLSTALAGQSGVNAVWLADGMDHGGAGEFGAQLAGLADAGLTVFEPGERQAALGISAGLGAEGRLTARIVRAAGGPRQGIVHALSARGERLSEARFSLAPGTNVATVSFDLPLELRNQVTRVVVSGERSAGAVALLDARSRWNRVMLVSGAQQEQAQPLLGPVYYIRRAMRPFAEVIDPVSASAGESIREGLKRNATVMMLADIGTLPGDVVQPLVTWMENGGVLVRFAGPRLEQSGGLLLPVPLRTGGRALGGALSWSTPQRLAEFPETSPFAGLSVPADVTIRRQVLADPAALNDDIDVWARLADGTPLVTSRQIGSGRLVLFHVTANSDWSNLPLSGLFVEMLRRTATLSAAGTAGEAAGGVVTAANDDTADAAEGASAVVLAPTQTLDGFGVLGPPPPTAKPVSASAIATLSPRFVHPPGYYGTEGGGQALNVIRADTELRPLPGLPAGATAAAYGGDSETDLKPWLLGAALLLLLIDMIAILLLQSGALARVLGRQGAAAASLMAVIAAGSLFALAGLTSDAAVAQSGGARTGISGASQIDADLARAATGKVTFGYVVTGDAGLDATSAAGLSGLVRVLTARTAVEPGPPMAVDIERDEIAFFPILYWPITEQADDLSDDASAKIDAYMKRGGMIIFDTRDYGQGIPLGFTSRGGGETPLQRVLSKLDVPRLEPVPDGHVLTKSFYLINAFPGRWAGGQLWVEATRLDPTGARESRQADGVSAILITANDFASAWALDENDQPLFPVVPGGERQREWAFRTGVNIVMYALTGNYKADQVHVPSLLQRLGQ